jgi:hypothetical protein
LQVRQPVLTSGKLALVRSWVVSSRGVGADMAHHVGWSDGVLFLGFNYSPVLRGAMHNSPSLLGLVLHLLKHLSQTHAHLDLED